MSCLLADDNEFLLAAVRCMLRSEGVEVVGLARSGLEALRLLRSLLATVIVLDVRLPDMNGLEVARRAAEIAQRKTPVIFFTSYADSKFVTDALDVGARAVVLKGTPPEHLLQAISTVADGGIYIDPQIRQAGEVRQLTHRANGGSQPVRRADRGHARRRRCPVHA